MSGYICIVYKAYERGKVVFCHTHDDPLVKYINIMSYNVLAIMVRFTHEFKLSNKCFVNSPSFVVVIHSQLKHHKPSSDVAPVLIILSQ